ncbi:MAG TPA: HAD family hydrolase [Stellaceae bacterium]
MGRKVGADHQQGRRAAARQGRAFRPRTPFRPHPDRRRARFRKPEERAYNHAMEVLGVGPHETWIVGDNLEWEIVAPQRLGIYAIWYDGYGVGLPRNSAIRPDRIIRRLSELLL